MKNINKIKKSLEVRIKRYHEDFSLCLMAEQWEEVLYRSLKDIGLSPKWDNDRSHKVGEDIFEKSIGRISCKSGAIGGKKKDKVIFNGSRTTRYKTIEEKLEFLSSDHDDFYFMLSKDKKDINNKNFKYKVLIFSSASCKVNKLNWVKTTSGYKGTGKFEAKISTSMSGQLWTTLPLNMIDHVIDINGNPS